MSDTPSQPPQKPRSTSVLDALTTPQAEQLEHWLFEENRSYVEVVGLMESTFGLKTSRSALSRYYDRALLPRRIGDDAEDLAFWHEYDEPNYELAWLVRAKQLGFQALAGPQPDIATAERMFRIVTATERMRRGREHAEREERRVALREHRTLVRKMPMTPRSNAKISEMDEVSLYREFRQMAKDGIFDLPERKEEPEEGGPGK